ncbi:MAG: hypothetical protein ACI9E1_002335 [Cryomorphaceae bacterium]|jgi:hypothetical protein
MKFNPILASCGAVISLLTSCGSTTIIKPDTLIMVKDIDIPSSEARIAQFATHTYLDYRENVDSPWNRIEVYNPKSGIVQKQISVAAASSTIRFNERVRILSQSDGLANPHFARDIRAFAASYDDSVYKSYPGPNSNTFMEKMIRKVEGVSAILDHNAIGKENGFYAGKTTGGTGLKLQTPVLGVALGLKEGVEVSALGLSGGVSIYPPSIRIPFLPKLPTWE